MDQPQVITALATPFTHEEEIDWQAFAKLLEHQVNGQVHGVVICGTTGESPTLSTQEKLSLIRRARALLPEHVSILAGTGGSNTDQSFELSRLALEAGARELLVVTPPYNRPTVAGLRRYYGKIAELGAPICLYHVPSRTGRTLSGTEIHELCQIPAITSVKEASGDLGFFANSVLECDVPFLTGDDPTYLPSLAAGGTGVISVVSNIFPKATVEIGRLYQNGQTQKSLALFQTLLPFIHALGCESNPGPLKAALKMAGFGENTLRSPLAPISQANLDYMESCYRKTMDLLGGFFRESSI